MSFDATKPANGALIIAAELRGQFNGLKDLIDAIPPGSVGPQGPQGPAGADGAPGAVGPAGPAGREVVGVSDNGSGQAVIQMSDGNTYGPFIVASGPQGMPGPQGNDGNQGAQGANGNDGGQGPQGAPGVDGVSISNVYDDGSGRAVVQLSNGSSYGPFTIASGPQGQQGEKGDRGDDGGQGPQGEQGPPGIPAANIETAEIHGTDVHDPSNGGNLLLRGGDVDGQPGARLELTGFVSSGGSGGGELHLTITALKINGETGLSQTINIGGTNLTFTHGILTAVS